MTEPDDMSRERFPWLRGGFDLEGWVGALAAWLVGILLGILWGPLFWIGAIGAVVILLATRSAERTPPENGDVLVAPCDGIVVSIGGATPPDELRLETGTWTRVRVSSSPATSNTIHAPIGGAIDHIIRETGDPAAFAAMKPDTPGLAVVYLSVVSGERAAGLRIATGGLGPRLEIDSESGDAVRLGRTLGTRRMGGWCDIYVPVAAAIEIGAGQTLIGSETVIARFGDTPIVSADPVEAFEEVVDAEPAETPAEDAPSTPEPETTDEPAERPDKDEDVADMLARLREEARKGSEPD